MESIIATASMGLNRFQKTFKIYIKLLSILYTICAIINHLFFFWFFTNAKNVEKVFIDQGKTCCML